MAQMIQKFLGYVDQIKEVNSVGPLESWKSPTPPSTAQAFVAPAPLLPAVTPATPAPSWLR